MVKNSPFYTQPYPSRKRVYKAMRDYGDACEQAALAGHYPPEEAIVIRHDLEQAEKRLRNFIKDLLDRAGVP